MSKLTNTPTANIRGISLKNRLIRCKLLSIKPTMVGIKTILLLVAVFIHVSLYSQSVKIAVLKYNGGGDWYANPTSLPNLIAYCNENINTNINPEPTVVEVGSFDIYNYPFLHMTGHGNVLFNDSEAENLRNYLLAGGFLHIDDNYGMDEFVRREMKKVFPEANFVELPFDYPIYSLAYKFETGLPKIHEHDNKAPQGFGIIVEGKLVCFYTYESDLGDGWEDQSIHNDSEKTRTEALKMGANIISYAFSTL